MSPSAPGNRPERLQWFHGLGFGMFIHWSIDSQLGSVIGHSMARASEEYLEKFTRILPSTFNPKSFDPDEWAVLARLAGMRYVVFTTKHHSGFCMFPTRSTEFNVANTAFGRDITAEIIEAFRRQGIAIGLYHSPDDFHFLHGKGLPVRRGIRPEACEGLLEHNKTQVRELLTNYGDIDIMFFDGPSDGLRELCWELRRRSSSPGERCARRSSGSPASGRRSRGRRASPWARAGSTSRRTRATSRGRS